MDSNALELVEEIVALNRRPRTFIARCIARVEEVACLYQFSFEDLASLFNHWAIVTQYQLFKHGEILSFWAPTVIRAVRLDTRANKPLAGEVHRRAADAILLRYEINSQNADFLWEGIASIHTDTLLRQKQIDLIPVERSTN